MVQLVSVMCKCTRPLSLKPPPLRLFFLSLFVRIQFDPLAGSPTQHGHPLRMTSQQFAHG